MTKAYYGGTSLFSNGGDHSSQWCQRWEAAVKLTGKHSVGKIRHLLEECLNLWQEDKFDLLV